MESFSTGPLDGRTSKSGLSMPDREPSYSAEYSLAIFGPTWRFFGNLTEIFALSAAFELLERGWQEPPVCRRSQASLIEAFRVLVYLQKTC